MYPSQFEHIQAETLEDAVSLLAEHEDAELLAGGQSLIPLQKMRLATPERVIDLNGLDELEYVTETQADIRIGAMTRHTAIQQSDAVKEHVPLFSECIGQIADRQVRNQGTMGGTVAEADPDGDYFPPLKLLDPEIVVVGPDGERTTNWEDLYLGMFTLDLEHEELISEVRLPKIEPIDDATAVGSAYTKHAERSGDYAIVGVAAIVHVDDSETIVDANLSVGAVGPLFRAAAAEDAVEGTDLSEDALERAAEAVSEEAMADAEGREGEYQEKMAGVFAKRALTSAYERAREEL